MMFSQGPRRDRSPLRDRDDRGPRGDRDRPRRSFPEDNFRDRAGGPPRDRPSGGARKGRTDRRVYVSNIPFEFRWQELKDLFRNEVGEVVFAEVFMDEGGKSRGCGIIEFDGRELVDVAIEKMHRFDLNGRKLVVKEDFGVERDRHGRILSERGGGRSDHGGPGRGPPRSDGRGGRDMLRGGGGFMGEPSPGSGAPEAKYANTYGLNINFLESLGIEGPLVNRVFVANLAYNVTEKQLKEVFGLAGKVMEVTINKDRDGNSKGHGVVEFDHPVEAVQAISMLNNQMYMDRTISVRMDRATERMESGSGMKLPQGLAGLGLGLGSNGKPLADVASKLETANPPAPAVPVAGVGAAQLGAAGLTANGTALGLMGGMAGAPAAAGFSMGVPSMAAGGAVGMAGLPGLAGVPGLGSLTAPAGLGQVGAGLPMAALTGGATGLGGAGVGSDDLRLGGRGVAPVPEPARPSSDRLSSRGGQYGGGGYSSAQDGGYGGARGGYMDSDERPRRSRWEPERDRAPPPAETNWGRGGSDGWNRSGGAGAQRNPARRW